MTSYLKYENKLVTCPYDPAHKVKFSRLQLHIAKCRLNHLDQEKEVCPFNATHLFDSSEKHFHLSNCPDRGVLDRTVAAKSLNENNPFKGRTAVPSYTASAHVVESDETWDIDTSVPRPGFIPQGPPPGAILEPRENAKPAERRQFYQELHRINADMPVPKVQPTASSQPLESRQPKMISEASKLQGVGSKFSNDFKNSGIGRGRIAAGIFPPDSNRPVDSKSYSAITNGMSQLGIGRGQSVQPGSFAPGMDDFPELGFGRGLTRNPKNAKAPGAGLPHQKS
ncbi:gametocyte-specific factor 1-like [Uloborus diversus]|uniref:gametocyte-specific factor 1-like n=1 Tax=Uloborus diversus TaxID=327109 RepID=UPI002408F466|nr:gametocyte-specific factor 1-like [Uloborus diversus]